MESKPLTLKSLSILADPSSMLMNYRMNFYYMALFYTIRWKNISATLMRSEYLNDTVYSNGLLQ